MKYRSAVLTGKLPNTVLELPPTPAEEYESSILYRRAYMVNFSGIRHHIQECVQWGLG